MSVLSQPQFHNEEAAFAFLEGVLWPEGPVCPHCGGMGRISKIAPNPKKRVRIGLHKCGDCARQFTVKVKTVFEHGRIPLHKFLQAVHLLCSSKKGISSHQLHRILGVQYRTAWFLSHRIREAMRDGSLSPLGGTGGIVEADETYIGRVRGVPKKAGTAHKHVVLTLVERGGSARSFHVDSTSIADIIPVVNANVSREAAMMTDTAPHYRAQLEMFGSHDMVNHQEQEYVRGQIHTNTVEGYYSIFKRGMKGIYQHCGERHLHRYLAEFDFRYSQRVALGIGDVARADKALKGMVGKRLTYRQPAN